MKSARFRLRPLAAWATPWHADSLFGALCWELGRNAGEAALVQTLQKFRHGPPPFIISDAFPADALPRPLAGLRISDAGEHFTAERAEPAEQARSTGLPLSGPSASAASSPVNADPQSAIRNS